MAVGAEVGGASADLGRGSAGCARHNQTGLRLIRIRALSLGFIARQLRYICCCCCYLCVFTPGMTSVCSLNSAEVCIFVFFEDLCTCPGLRTSTCCCGSRGAKLLKMKV